MGEDALQQGVDTGMDVAEIVDGRIGRLWVLLDPPVA